jgi:peptide/nickel transport system substrate-binding protein
VENTLGPVQAGKEGSKMDGSDGRRALCSAVSILLVFALVLGTVTLLVSEDVVAQEEELILRIGCQDEPKTRSILAAEDVWTHNVLDPVYDTVTKVGPETDELKPYILKGTDINGNGMFDEGEYGRFGTIPGRPLEVTAFYDFNGVLFHDGYQATVGDLLFTYHMDALDPRTITLDVLKDENNKEGTNYTMTRWLSLWKVSGFDSGGDWQLDHRPEYDDPDYNISLRSAVHFNQQSTYAYFYRYTMSWRILPAYIWEGTGCIYNKTSGSFDCDIHKKDGDVLDFGVAYDPVLGNGVPPNSVDPPPFDFESAESWDIPDEYVIGTGPFKFDKWEAGKFASLTRNDEYYVGEPYLHLPYIDGMLFKVFRTTQTVIFALRSGDIDYVAWPIPAAFIPELINDPNIELVSTHPKGFSFLSYNMRMEPFGYIGGDPRNADMGIDFRQAVSYLIDKKTIVSLLLQNYGIAGDSPVSPTLARWYNDSLPQFGFNPGKADALLDKYDHWNTSDGPCISSGSGCRSFPGIGTQEIRILSTNADYDPVQAATGNLIAQAMRSVGINVRSQPTAFGEIIRKIDARNFHMFILGWRIGVDPPEYFHSFFHTRNAARGQNYPGYQNPNFDHLIDMSRETLVPQEQYDLIKEAQGVLAWDRPYDVMYFRTNIEAYRSDRFVNWTVGEEGSIYHYWSWIGIHPPWPEPLRITTSIQSALRTDMTAQFVTTVRDPQGDILPGATVHAYVASGSGNFIVGIEPKNVVSGLTDLNGQFEVTYDPPPLKLSDTPRTVLLHAKAMHPSYNESRNVTTTVKVYPVVDSFLVLLVELLEGNSVDEGLSIPIRVQVIDQDENPVEGADVVMTSTPPADVNPNSGVTDANGFVDGVEDIAFTAPTVVGDTYFLIETKANKTGYFDAWRYVSLVVNDVNQLPSVSIDSISQGQTLIGVVNVTGTAGDPDGNFTLVNVDVRIDDGNWQLANGTTSWYFELNTTLLPEDSHTVYARSFDGINYSSLASVTATVNNYNDPPTVSIGSPSPGQTVSGTLNVEGNAHDPDGDNELVRVEAQIDDEGWEEATGTTDWTHELDTTSLSEGTHTVHARSYDGMEYSTEDSVDVFVDNINEPPTVSITSISPGQTVNLTVIVAGDAHDPDGDSQLVKVEVRIDNEDWQDATGTIDWSFELDTTSLSNGDHNITARAYDGTQYSTPVEVPFVVENEIPGPDDILGEFLWLWILLVIVVAVAIVLLLLLRRRRKLEVQSQDTSSEEESV